MLRKFLIFSVTCFTFLFLWSAASAEYRDEKLINVYTNYIEKNVGDIIQAKSEEERREIIVKIDQAIQKYTNANVSNKVKKDTINLLYALKSYTEWTLQQLSHSIAEPEVIIRIIDDMRCSDCATEYFEENLKAYDFLEGAIFVYEDFSDSGVKEYMIQNDLLYLPAIVFNTNNFDDDELLVPYLWLLEGWDYALNIGSDYDPFMSRSERWYQVLDFDTLSSIRENSYILGNENAEVLLLTYGGIDEPYTARLYNDGVIDDILANHENEVQHAFQHFPLEFQSGSLPWAEILECIGEQQWSEAFYDVLDRSLETYEGFWLDIVEVIQFGYERWISADEIVNCDIDDRYLEKIETQMEQWKELFGISGSPASIIINTETWEYEVLNGAFPYESFKEIIEGVLTK